MKTGPINVFIGWGKERVNIKRRFKLCVYICILWCTSVAHGHIHTVPCVPGLKYSEVSVWQLWMLSSLNGRLERSKGNSWRGDNCRVLPGGHAAAVPTPPPLVKSSVWRLQWQPVCFKSHSLFSVWHAREATACKNPGYRAHFSYLSLCLLLKSRHKMMRSTAETEGIRWRCLYSITTWLIRQIKPL